MSKQLIAAIEEQERLAQGSGQIQEDRQKAIDHYLRRPYGDEEEGRSQVVMGDVQDTIEWIKPSLLKIFCSGDEVARFDPVGPEDEQQAEQETEYVNHIIQQKNQGFLVFHDWFHDALLTKNGYVWAQAVEEQRTTRQSYNKLTDDEFALLLQNQELEVLEHEETVEIGSDMAPYRYHSAVVAEKRSYPCIKIKNVAPERVAVAQDWPGVTLDGCPFVRIVEYPTISELRQMGYEVADDINDGGGVDEDSFVMDRRDPDGEDDDLLESADAATRRVRTRYVWMNYDKDGDGIAELRFIVLVGDTILEDEETDLTPVAGISAGRMPHEHNGLSIDDAVSDLQRIRTVLMRGFLDNMYLANNGRNIIDTNTVNLDDMLTVRPGGVVRNKGPVNTAVAPLLHPQIGNDILTAVEYVDSVRENRTGVTKYNQGLDSDALNKTATGVNSIMNASQQRIELIARLFAETGVKSLMLIVHALSLKNTRQRELIKLRNQWVPVDPSSWKTRSDVTVSVGIGTGNKDQMLQHLMMMWQMQLQGLQLGIATPQNLFTTASKLSQNAGFKQPELFWTNPATQQPQPPQPSPEQIKAQAEAQKVQFEAQAQAAENEKDRAAKLREVEIQEQNKYRLKLMELAAGIISAQVSARQEAANLVAGSMLDQSAQTPGLNLEQLAAAAQQIDALTSQLGAQ